MVCTFFGHRDTADLEKDKIKQAIIKEIEDNNTDTFYVGNHGNFDRMVFSVLKDLKKIYSEISINVVLSYQPKDNGEDLSYTVFPEGIENVPKRFAINFRNKWMIERSDTVIAYVCHSFGGAAKFVDMARKKGEEDSQFSRMIFRFLFAKGC